VAASVVAKYQTERSIVEFPVTFAIGVYRPMPEEIRAGTLYIVPTPIGNLDDITYRAVKILSAVDVIAAEDTRHRRKILLDHLQIQKPLLSFFSHNETIRVPQIIEKLRGGLAVALVSDAGTPGISDPAYSIIQACIQNELRHPAPGPTACCSCPCRERNADAVVCLRRISSTQEKAFNKTRPTQR